MDALALEIGHAGDPRRAPRDDPVKPFGHRHHRPQVRVLDRIAQQLGLGIGRDVGHAFLAEARHRRRADQVGDAAHPHAGLAGVEILRRQQHRRDLEGLLVAVDRDRAGIVLRGSRGRKAECQQSGGGQSLQEAWNHFPLPLAVNLMDLTLPAPERPARPPCSSSGVSEFAAGPK